MIKAAFFDIDGTIFSHFTKQVPPSAIQALRELQDRGVLRIAATGRHLLELQDMDLLKYDFDGYITLNGQICLDRQYNVIYGNPFTDGDRDALIRLFEHKEMPLILMEKDRMYINYVDEHVVRAHEDIYTRIPDIREYRGDILYMSAAYCMKDREDFLARQIGDCTFTRWSRHGVDIIPRGADKVSGIEQFLAYTGIRREEAMAFGDGENDVAMLEYAAVGVALGNAKNEQIKAAADYVTDHIDEDGLRNALVRFGVIGK